ncbi:hypothetical protein SGGMMB4_03405 [Sodalis glossinidius str. 'morsitans']|uniref:Uncharacterized protein n=1 Tax=Sodalis glossinidius (strain morsitans) TaxID=343509 RepID=A0A193QK52_SODGM|nr:hypothetical protein SGGMMB4_03405 [Sodalis glossinidius str. 'morsitans']
MLELAADIARLLNLWAIPKEQFRSLMYYIAERGNTSDESEFLQHIAAKATDYREDIMTIAEQLEAKGIQLGEQKGIEKGEKLALLKVAQHMLDSCLTRTAVKQFPVSPIMSWMI